MPNPDDKNEGHETNSEAVTFEGELGAMGFDEKTAKKLKDGGFSSLADLALLAEEEEAIKDLKLSLAQRLLLLREVRKMSGKTGQMAAGQHEQGAAMPVHAPPHRSSEVTTPGATLSQVLGELRRDGVGASTSGPSGNTAQHTSACMGGSKACRQQSASTSSTTAAERHSACGGQMELLAPTVTQSADPQIYLRGGCDPKDIKVYEIVDYIHLVPPVVEEKLVSEHGESQLYYRDAPKKPKLQNVTVEEWCLANTRIMDLLMSTQCLDANSLRDYMCYTMNVCELFKHYQRTTVLQYDREYRHLQARHGFRWGIDCAHQRSLHLRLKTTTASFSSSSGTSRGQGHQRRSQAAGGGSQQVCFQYNSREGCSYGDDCKYKHSCSAQGCTASHPKVEHHTRGATVAGSHTR